VAESGPMTFIFLTRALIATNALDTYICSRLPDALMFDLEADCLDIFQV